MDLRSVISAAGGTVKVARAIGVNHSTVAGWVRDGAVPIKRVPAMARLTGIPAHTLRPDFFEPTPAKRPRRQDRG